MKAVAGRGQRAGDGDGCTAEAVQGAQSWGEPRPGGCGREGLHTGRGCTAHAHAHTHLPMHLHMHLHMHLRTSHGCSRRRSWRCSWPAARGGGVAHVVAGWSTVGPPRELRCAACGKHFGAPSPGTGGPLPTGGGVTKVARSAPRCLPGSRVGRRALQVRCLGGLRSTRLLLLDPPEWMPLCRVVAWGGCARSGVSR